MTRFYQGQNAGPRPAWEAPAVAALPIHKTSATWSWYIDVWKGGTLIGVTAPHEPPSGPKPCQIRVVPEAQRDAAGWEAPAITALAIGAGTGK
jgi:hypothetical protein